jgi:hypothetical protein
MKNIPAILFFMALSLHCKAQQTIRGRVVNAASGAAVPGSSVFITNTSKGTVSDNAGNFVLTDVPPGKHELIISSIGYETNVFPFSQVQLPLQLKVELSIKVKELENVTVEPSVEEGWDKWGRVFMDHFIGTTAHAAQCRIKNEKALRFRYYKKSRRLTAYCDEPVLLENKALGYTISYQLENFEVNYADKTMFFLGYSLFEPIDRTNRTRQQKWAGNREAAYAGSVMHFMRSLYADQLFSEGFEVRRLVRTPNREKERVRKLYSTGRVLMKTGVAGVVIETKKDSGHVHRDSINYYESVLRQKDVIETVGRDLLSADSLIIEEQGEYKFLHFTDHLYITFNREKEEEGYVQTQFPQRMAGFQHSMVTLLNDQLIMLDKNGNYFSPQDFFTSGYWGWSEKMAGSLPLDFKPGQ